MPATPMATSCKPSRHDGAAEAVGDDHRNMESGALLELAVNTRRRAIGIERQQHGGLAAVHVGNVDTAIGTDQAMCRLGNKHVLLAHHPFGLAQGKLNDAGVGSVFRCEAFGSC